DVSFAVRHLPSLTPLGRRRCRTELSLAAVVLQQKLLGPVVPERFGGIERCSGANVCAADHEHESVNDRSRQVGPASACCECERSSRAAEQCVCVEQLKAVHCVVHRSVVASCDGQEAGALRVLDDASGVTKTVLSKYRSAQAPSVV